MRTERYQDLLPIERIREARCTIIGVGAIGRQVGLQLAAMGVPHIQLVDFDTVEEVNLGPQGYLQDDVGRAKVHATANLMQELNHMLDVDTINERYARSLQINSIVFCCVDSIVTRRHIWSSIQNRVEFFIDGRMAAEVLRVVTVSDGQSRREYPSTLFQEGEALRQTCTARSTVYCANIAAGVMVSQFTQWLRGFPLTFDVTLNLLSLELVTSTSATPTTQT
jgi:molybdopterin/thiamine biosynthesis adenylyltransferase